MITGTDNAILIQGMSGQQLLESIEQMIDAKFASIAQKNSSKKHYSVKELAEASPVCEQTIRNWITSGKLKAKKLGGRLLIDESDFHNALSDVKSLKYKR